MTDQDVKLPDIEVELPKLPPMGYGNEGYSAQAMHEYAVEYAYKFARAAIIAERERCARLADSVQCWGNSGPAIAAAIRSGK